MAVSFHPLRPIFAAEATGLDLAHPITRADVAAIHEAMDRYAVLVFPKQDITDQQQIDFTRQLGPLENYPSGGHIRARTDTRLGAGISDFSNLDRNGNIISDQDRIWFFKLGDRLWHSDSSFRPIPASYSLLSGRTLPSWGGNTDFADMRAAHDALDARTKVEVEELVCRHSLRFSREAIGFTDLTPHEIDSFRPVRQRLVRTHPRTGRKSLFLSSHAGEIEGWTVPEARSFLRDLIEHATQPSFVYSHAWRRNDLVMWDNATTMHRARRFDRQEIRDMRRTTLAGHAPTIEQEMASIGPA